ncbi:MarR family winged helix-turn-helix transcriptional regulator [Maridesulfovibrio sp.]|uniref:MarR family winged helix-turn-helix transcriptional regulator n=1 Tax=Maridesulfovibrio sp. TaxID=2795000 RepID=UPI003BAA9A80
MTDQPQISDYLSNCLFFTVNTLSRVVGRLADEAFAETGISPAHAFLMMLVNEQPGIIQKDLTAALHLAPSTVTRFVDSLQKKGFVERKTEGKLSRVYPTEAGEALRESIAEGWKNLYLRYSEILGEEEGKLLTSSVFEAGRKLEDA